MEALIGHLPRTHTQLYSEKGTAVYSSNLLDEHSSPIFVRWDVKTLNTPYKAGLTASAEGFALVSGAMSGWHTIVCWTKGGTTSSNMWVHTYDSGKAYGWRKYTTDDSLNARFMDMSDFTIAKIKSIYRSDIPVVGCINYTSSISPDKSTGFVFAAKHVATMITMAGNIYGLSTEDNWVKKNSI